MLAIMVDNLNIGKLPKKETAADNKPTQSGNLSKCLETFYRKSVYKTFGSDYNLKIVKCTAKSTKLMKRSALNRNLFFTIESTPSAKWPNYWALPMIIKLSQKAHQLKHFLTNRPGRIGPTLLV